MFGTDVEGANAFSLDDTLIVFPAGTSASPGMAEPLWNAYPEAYEVYKRAAVLLGVSPETLNRPPSSGNVDLTWTSLATFVNCAAMTHVLEHECGMGSYSRPHAYLGGSLGIISAMYAASAISLDHALKFLVDGQRTLYHPARAKLHYGTIRLMGVSINQAQSLLESDDIELTVDCSPAYVTLTYKSTETSATLTNRQKKVIGKSLRRRIRGVLGPDVEIRMAYPARHLGLHNSLCRPAIPLIRDLVSDLEITDPAVPIISECGNGFLNTADDLRVELSLLLASPVLLSPVLRFCSELGIRRFVEIGPGTRTSLLIRRIIPTASIVSVNTQDPKEAVSRFSALFT